MKSRWIIERRFLGNLLIGRFPWRKSAHFDRKPFSFSLHSRDVSANCCERNFPNPNEFRYFFDHR